MVLHKAFADAQMRLALGADVASLRAALGADAALLTIPLFLRENRVMLLGKRDSCAGSSACLHCLPIGSEQLHQRAHELFTEIELPRSILADPPQLEGIHNAHVQQPPREARTYLDEHCRDG